MGELYFLVLDLVAHCQSLRTIFEIGQHFFTGVEILLHHTLLLIQHFDLKPQGILTISFGYAPAQGRTQATKSFYQFSPAINQDVCVLAAYGESPKHAVMIIFFEDEVIEHLI